MLSAITTLKKLCNHPKLIYDALHSKVGAAGRALVRCVMFALLQKGGGVIAVCITGGTPLQYIALIEAWYSTNMNTYRTLTARLPRALTACR